MCILAGCDFLSSCPGIGLKKAHQQLRKFKSFVKVGWAGGGGCLLAWLVICLPACLPRLHAWHLAFWQLAGCMHPPCLPLSNDTSK